jgi:hypothetical protein
MTRRLTSLLLLATAPLFADGPKDNLASEVRPVPPLGIEVPGDVRTKLTDSLKKLRAAIDDAAKAQAKNPKLADLLPDIEVYYKGLDWALKHNEFFKPDEFKTAEEQLAEAMERAAHLKIGNTPWTKQTGLVVRGYKSKIDGSVQPYGMVVPENGFDGPKRLDIWCHGRFENVGELQFIQQNRKTTGSIQPANTLVLPSHGKPFVGLHERVAQLHAHHADRLAEVVQACTEQPCSAMDILPVMFKRTLDVHQTTFAVGEALAHLNLLWLAGQLGRQLDAQGVFRFSAA